MVLWDSDDRSMWFCVQLRQDGPWMARRFDSLDAARDATLVYLLCENRTDALASAARRNAYERMKAAAA